MGEVEQLVRRSKKRNPDAFTELMQLHERDMYRTASAILSQDADIADAMQETILTCWEKMDTLQKNRYFKTWMIRILINKCKDILRLGRRMVCVEELPEQETGSTVEAEANLEWKEALRGLDEKYRLIVVLFYAEGLRTANIPQGRSGNLPKTRTIPAPAWLPGALPGRNTAVSSICRIRLSPRKNSWRSSNMYTNWITVCRRKYGSRKRLITGWTIRDRLWKAPKRSI